MKIKKAAELSAFFENCDIGLLEVFLDKYRGSLKKVFSKNIGELIRKRPQFGHKGTFGHVLLIAGSETTPGAAILASKAALRSGCGLLTSMVPEVVISPMLAQLPESMIFKKGSLHLNNTDTLKSFDVIGFGPGAGKDDTTADLLHYLLVHYQKPMVIDADGLSLLSLNKDWYTLLHNNIILTPHPAEFDRLTIVHNSELQRLEAAIDFSMQYKAHIVLKGHRTAIVSDGNVWFNTTGNNGMATAGSGDVLTGIISSLCAQGYEPCKASVTGVYLHGYAGDCAAGKVSRHSMIASDIVNEIGTFFKEFE